MDGQPKFKIDISTRDRVMHAWISSMELTRDFQNYYIETKDDEAVARLFAEFAEDEALHASRLFELLHRLDGGQPQG